MSRNLTEKQQKFLDVLFEEARGNPATARKLAGYADTVATSSITNVLQDEIADITKKFISSTATKAAYSMYEVMSSPTDLGNKEKMTAADASTQRYLAQRYKEALEKAEKLEEKRIGGRTESLSPS